MENFALPSGHEDLGRRAVLLRPGKEEAEAGEGCSVYPVSSCLGCKQNLKHQQGCFRGLLKSLPDCIDATTSPLPPGRSCSQAWGGISATPRWMGHPWRDATAAPVEAAYSIASQGLGLLSNLPWFSPFTVGEASLQAPNPLQGPCTWGQQRGPAWCSRCQATCLPPLGFHGDGAGAQSGG